MDLGGVFRFQQLRLHGRGGLAPGVLPALGLEQPEQWAVTRVDDAISGDSCLGHARASPAHARAPWFAEYQPDGAAIGLCRVVTGAATAARSLDRFYRLWPGRLLCPLPTPQPGSCAGADCRWPIGGFCTGGWLPDYRISPRRWWLAAGIHR